MRARTARGSFLDPRTKILIWLLANLDIGGISVFSHLTPYSTLPDVCSVWMA